MVVIRFFLLYTFRKFFPRLRVFKLKMSKVNKKRRSFLIKRKRQRREKLQKLKKLYHQSKNPAEKEKIKEKIKKLAPFLEVEAYLKEKSKV